MSGDQQTDAGSAWQADVAELAAEVERVARRLRGLGEPRLRRPLPAYGTVAEAAHTLAQALADAGQGVELRAEERAPSPRTLPRLSDLAVGDQVAVTGQDLAAALAAVAPASLVWRGERQASAAEVLAASHALTREIKLAID